VRNVKITWIVWFFFNLGEYREDGHLEVITFLHWEALGWFSGKTGRKIQGWMAHSSRDLFLTESFPVLFSLFCISCQLRVFYFSFLMVRYIYPHFGCPSNIWWGFKLCQDTRLFCWLDKLPTTSRIKKLTLWCQVIGIGKGGNGVESSSLYTFYPYSSSCGRNIIVGGLK
jgi:hypothetical protein